MIQPAALCRFIAALDPDVRVGLVDGAVVRDLTPAGVHRLHDLLERVDLHEELARLFAAPVFPSGRSTRCGC